jgi:hypothetical protein
MFLSDPLSSLRARITTVALFAVVSSLHCHREPTEVATTEPTSGQATDSTKPCPLGVEGSVLTLADVRGGIDVTMTAAPDRIGDLRARIRAAAALHGAGSHKGLGHNGSHLGAHRHGLRLTALPPLDATVEDVKDGARLHLVAKVGSEVDPLRAQLRDRVTLVLAAQCD